MLDRPQSSIWLFILISMKGRKTRTRVLSSFYPYAWEHFPWIWNVELVYGNNKSRMASSKTWNNASIRHEAKILEMSVSWWWKFKVDRTSVATNMKGFFEMKTINFFRIEDNQSLKTLFTRALPIILPVCWKNDFKFALNLLIT